MNKIIRWIIPFFLIVSLIFFLYLVYENVFCLKVKKVTVSHYKIPQEFDRFRIIQITDLHERSFGKNQAKLIKKISKQNYDLILLTGDYLDTKSRTPNPEPLYALIRNLPRNKPIFYILGNADYLSPPIERCGDYGYLTIEKNLEQLGCRPVYPGLQICKGKSCIWLTDWQLRALKTEQDLAKVWAETEKVFKKPEVITRQKLYAQKEYDLIQKLKQTDFTIAVTHAPLDFDYDRQIEIIGSTNNSKSEKKNKIFNNCSRFLIDWDLNLAGHTHGGQIRLPFWGAVISPSGELFPEDRDIKGLWQDKSGRWQYICSGLGTSGPSMPVFGSLIPLRLV